MAKIKVLHLIDSSGMYGAERVILTLIDELKNSKFPGILGCIRENVNIVPGIGKEAINKLITVKYFTMRRGLNPFGLVEILNFINNNKIKIVHSHGYKTNIYMSSVPRRKFKTISTVHGWEKEANNIKTKIYQLLDCLALKSFDKVVAVSKGVANDLVKRGFSMNYIDTIYNGISFTLSTNKVLSSTMRNKYNLSHDDFIIGTAGRLSKVKGHYYLIKAMKIIINENKKCKLVIAGDGPLRNEFNKLIERHKLSSHVKLIGYINNIEHFLNMIDLFVLPSLSEGLPISLLEAMAMRKPVIATSVGGIPEMITSENEGVLVPPKEINALSQKIMELFLDDARRLRVSIKGGEKIKTTFLSSIMANKYEKLYGKLIMSD